MTVIKSTGLLLIVLGIVSAVVLLLHAFGLEIRGSVLEFWVLYGICYCGGFFLYASGSVSSSGMRLLQFTSGILIVIGVCSAVGIFLDKITVLSTQSSWSLWLLFLLSVTGGVIGFFSAEGLNQDAGR